MYVYSRNGQMNIEKETIVEVGLFTGLILLLWFCASQSDINGPNDLMKHDQKLIDYEEYIFESYLHNEMILLNDEIFQCTRG